MPVASPVDFFQELGIDTKTYNSGSHYVQCPKCHDDRKKKASKELLINFEKGYCECFHCGWSEHILTYYAGKTDEKPNWTPPPPKPQKFIEKEPIFNWIVPDIVTEPQMKKPLDKQYHLTFYYRNFYGKLTGAKKVLYNFPEFKRDKETIPLHLFTRDSGYYPCLFYERDLALYPSAKVLLVESEKTAARLRSKFKDYLKEFIYLGTGGANGLTIEKIKHLKGRDVLIVYDCDTAGREGGNTAMIRCAGVTRSCYLVDIDSSKEDGTDLADVIDKVDINYIRSLTGKITIAKDILSKIRQFNIEGRPWNKDTADDIAKEHFTDLSKVYEIGRIYYDNHRDEHNLSRLPLLKRIEHYLIERFEFKRNCFTKRISYRSRDESEFRFCNYNDIWRLLQHNLAVFGAKPKDIGVSIVSNMLESDFVPEYNPFVDYFNSLPHWDGVDHITKLADHVQCDDQPFWTVQFKKALVRMIACTYGAIENRIIMVFVQEVQNTGKSSFLRFLCPPELREYYKEDPMQYNKDTEIALTQNFIWNLEELAQLNKKEISELKAIISRQKVKQRRAYARQEESQNRIVNFWGSTNKVEFLTDTSNTRWLCFQVKSISHDYSNYNTGKKEVDINKVWSQAWYLYKSGFNYNLDTQEQEIRDLTNRNFEIMTEEKQLMLKYLIRCDKEDPAGEFMMNAEIHQYLIEQTHNKLRLSPERMGVSMSQLDFVRDIKKMGGKMVRGYYVIKKPLPNGTVNGYSADSITQSQAPEPVIPNTDELPF